MGYIYAKPCLTTGSRIFVKNFEYILKVFYREGLKWIQLITHDTLLNLSILMFIDIEYIYSYWPGFNLNICLLMVNIFIPQVFYE